jgi:hypothetical protein
MTLRPALLLLIASLVAGCVSTGNVDPMKTDKGRDEAHQATEFRHLLWLMPIGICQH